MKTFVYISDRKVDLYYAQVPVRLLDSLDLKASFEQFGLKLKLERATERERGRISKLLAVLRHLERHEDIGTVDDPKPFFRGDLQLFWGPAANVADTVVFAGQTKSTCLLLCGSWKHVLGAEPTNPGGISAGYSPGIHGTRFFHQLLHDETFRDSVTAARGYEDEEAPTWSDLVSIADYSASASSNASMNVKFYQPRFEFLCRRLIQGETRVTWNNLVPQKVLLGTPLFVAQLD